MALKKQISENLEIVAKVRKIEFSKHLESICVEIEFFEIQNELILKSSILPITIYLPANQDLFSLERMNLENENPIKSTYLFLKEKNPLFSDFEDC